MCPVNELTKLQQSLDNAVASEDFVIAAMLRDDGSTVASGHPVLGTPVGTDAYVRGGGVPLGLFGPS